MLVSFDDPVSPSSHVSPITIYHSFALYASTAPTAFMHKIYFVGPSLAWTHGRYAEIFSSIRVYSFDGKYFEVEDER